MQDLLLLLCAVCVLQLAPAQRISPLPEDGSLEWSFLGQELHELEKMTVKKPFKSDPGYEKRQTNRITRQDDSDEEGDMPIKPLSEDEDVRLPTYDQDARDFIDRHCRAGKCDFSRGVLLDGDRDRRRGRNGEEKGKGKDSDDLRDLKDELRRQIRRSLKELERSLSRTRGKMLHAAGRGESRDDRPVHAWNRQSLDGQFCHGNCRVILIRKNKNGQSVDPGVSHPFHRGHEHDQDRHRDDAMLPDGVPPWRRSYRWISSRMPPSEHSPLPQDPDYFPHRRGVPPYEKPRFDEPERKESSWQRLKKVVLDWANRVREHFENESRGNQIAMVFVISAIIALQVLVAIKVYSTSQDDGYDELSSEEDDHEKVCERKRCAACHHSVTGSVVIEKN